MKKLHFAILFVVFIFLGCMNETVKIGVVIPKSGSASFIGGKDIQGALEMAEDEINENGGIQGKKLQIITADSESSVEGAKRAFKSLAKQSPLMIMNISSLTAAPVIELADKNEIPLLSLITTSDRVFKNSKWAYKYYPGEREEFTPIASLLEKYQTRSLSVIYSDEEWGRSVYSRFKSELPGKGVEVRGIKFSLDNPDFSKAAEKALETDAVYIAGYGGFLKELLKQLEKKSYTGKKFCASSLSSVYKSKDLNAEGIHLAAPRIYAKSYYLVEKVKGEFEKKYETKFNHYSANVYDAVLMMGSLMNNMDEEPSPAAIKQKFDGGFSYGGVLGIVSLQSGSRLISFPLYPARISNNEIEYLNNTLLK